MALIASSFGVIATRNRIYFIHANLGADGAGELSQELEYDDFGYDDYPSTGVHAHPTLNTYQALQVVC